MELLWKRAVCGRTASHCDFFFFLNFITFNFIHNKPNSYPGLGCLGSYFKVVFFVCLLKLKQYMLISSTLLVFSFYESSQLFQC